MNPSLQQVLQRPDIWRSHQRERVANVPRGHATGFAPLDRELLGGGWPRAALTELMLAQPGIGELYLLAPLLAELSRQRLLQVWINPPFVPYAPALMQRGIALDSVLIVRAEPQHHLWTCEQALRSAGCGAVLFWPAQPLRYPELRKLQVAAATQAASGFLFRDRHAIAQPSPAVLRLQLEASAGDLSIRIAKQRGHIAGQTVSLPREHWLGDEDSPPPASFVISPIPSRKSLCLVASPCGSACISRSSHSMYSTAGMTTEGMAMAARTIALMTTARAR